MDDQIVCPNCHSRTSRSSGTCSFCGQSLDTQNQPLISEHDSSSSNQEHDLESSISMFARMLHEISSERSSSSSQDNTRYTPLEVQIESDIDPPSLASNSEYTVFPLRETGFNRANTASQSPVEDEHETESLLHTEDLNSSDSTPSEDHNTNASGNRPPPSDRQRQINREMATNLLLLQTLLARNMRQNRERQRHARTSQQNQESGSNSSNNDPSPGRLPTRIDRNSIALPRLFILSVPTAEQLQSQSSLPLPPLPFLVLLQHSGYALPSSLIASLLYSVHVLYQLRKYSEDPQGSDRARRIPSSPLSSSRATTTLRWSTSALFKTSSLLFFLSSPTTTPSNTTTFVILTFMPSRPFLLPSVSLSLCSLVRFVSLLSFCRYRQRQCHEHSEAPDPLPPFMALPNATSGTPLAKEGMPSSSGPFLETSGGDH